MEASQGTGDYSYVPDTEAANNQGFQKFVAYPGSDTAASANGGEIAANGTWSTSIVVPGAVFEAVSRFGGNRTIDCREVTCGIITIGAHGVANSTNETFTPVTVADLYDEAPSSPSAGSGSSGSSSSSGTASNAAPAAPEQAEAAAAGAPSLEVDRGGAVAGRVLPFQATGLPARRQMSVTFDDGAAAAGPFQVGSDGSLAGVITIPEDTRAGTHELRIFGLDEDVTVSFAVQAADDADGEGTAEEAVADDSGGTDWYAVAFVVLAAIVLLAALVRLVLLRRRKA